MKRYAIQVHKMKKKKPKLHMLTFTVSKLERIALKQTVSISNGGIHGRIYSSMIQY